jgi:hypothetical protein
MNSISVTENDNARKKEKDLALIREFATAALNGLISDSEIDMPLHRFADASFNYADAMLAEYKKRYGVE